MPEKKQLLINSATAAIGGGLLVATDLIKAICKNPDYSVTLVCPPVSVYQKLDVPARKIFVPAVFLKFYSRWWLDFFWLQKIIKRDSPDLVITLGNLPAICRCRQIMFNDNAFVSENSLSGFNLTKREFLVHFARKFIFIRRLRFIQLLIVQTELEKDKFEKNLKKPPKIKVLAPLFPSHVAIDSDIEISLPVIEKHAIRLGCISYVHGHKNISVLVDVLEAAKKIDFPLQIIFTLSPMKSAFTRKLAKKLKPYIQSGLAYNLGKVRPTNIPGLIRQIDGLILPSLNESYSLNYIEALNFKKHLFVSDRLFARKICSNHAWYFEPTSPSDIIKSIVDVFSNEAKRNKTGGLPLEQIIPIGNISELYDIINAELI